VPFLAIVHCLSHQLSRLSCQLSRLLRPSCQLSCLSCHFGHSAFLAFWKCKSPNETLVWLSHFFATSTEADWLVFYSYISGINEVFPILQEVKQSKLKSNTLNGICLSFYTSLKVEKRRLCVSHKLNFVETVDTTIFVQPWSVTIFPVCLLFKLNDFVWLRVTLDQWNLVGYVAKLTRFLAPFEHVLFTCSETFQVLLHKSL